MYGIVALVCLITLCGFKFDLCICESGQILEKKMTMVELIQALWADAYHAKLLCRAESGRLVIYKQKPIPVMKLCSENGEIYLDRDMNILPTKKPDLDLVLYHTLARKSHKYSQNFARHKSEATYFLPAPFVIQSFH